MEIVMTLAAGEDIARLEANIAFHLAAGVTKVLVGGGEESVPETVVARHGAKVVSVPHELHLPTVAVDDHGADWVLEGSVDEYWWPRADSIATVVETVPGRYGCVQALGRTFVATAVPGEPFFEGAVHRVAYRAGAHDPSSPWAPFRRFAVRAGGIRRHEVQAIFRFWYPFEVLRVPSQGEATPLNPSEAFVEDTRLRDALRALTSGHSPTFARPDAADDAEFALEVEALGDADLIALREQADRLAARLAAIERSPLLAVELRGRRLMRPVLRRVRR